MASIMIILLLSAICSSVLVSATNDLTDENNHDIIFSTTNVKSNEVDANYRDKRHYQTPSWSTLSYSFRNTYRPTSPGHRQYSNKNVGYTTPSTNKRGNIVIRPARIVYQGPLPPASFSRLFRPATSTYHQQQYQQQQRPQVHYQRHQQHQSQHKTYQHDQRQGQQTQQRKQQGIEPQIGSSLFTSFVTKLEPDTSFVISPQQLDKLLSISRQSLLRKSENTDLNILHTYSTSVKDELFPQQVSGPQIDSSSLNHEQQILSQERVEHPQHFNSPVQPLSNSIFSSPGNLPESSGSINNVPLQISKQQPPIQQQQVHAFLATVENASDNLNQIQSDVHQIQPIRQSVQSPQPHVSFFQKIESSELPIQTPELIQSSVQQVQPVSQILSVEPPQRQEFLFHQTNQFHQIPENEENISFVELANIRSQTGLSSQPDRPTIQPIKTEVLLNGFNSQSAGPGGARQDHVTSSGQPARGVPLPVTQSQFIGAGSPPVAVGVPLPTAVHPLATSAVSAFNGFQLSQENQGGSSRQPLNHGQHIGETQIFIEESQGSSFANIPTSQSSFANIPTSQSSFANIPTSQSFNLEQEISQIQNNGQIISAAEGRPLPQTFRQGQGFSQTDNFNNGQSSNLGGRPISQIFNEDQGINQNVISGQSQPFSQDESQILSQSFTNGESGSSMLGRPISDTFNSLEGISQSVNFNVPLSSSSILGRLLPQTFSSGQTFGQIQNFNKGQISSAVSRGPPSQTFSSGQEFGQIRNFNEGQKKSVISGRPLSQTFSSGQEFGQIRNFNEGQINAAVSRKPLSQTFNSGQEFGQIQNINNRPSGSSASGRPLTRTFSSGQELNQRQNFNDRQSITSITGRPLSTTFSSGQELGQTQTLNDRQSGLSVLGRPLSTTFSSGQQFGQLQNINNRPSISFVSRKPISTSLFSGQELDQIQHFNNRQRGSSISGRPLSTIFSSGQALSQTQTLNDIQSASSVSGRPLSAAFGSGQELAQIQTLNDRQSGSSVSGSPLSATFSSGQELGQIQNFNNRPSILSMEGKPLSHTSILGIGQTHNLNDRRISSIVRGRPLSETFIQEEGSSQTSNLNIGQSGSSRRGRPNSPNFNELRNFGQFVFADQRETTLGGRVLPQNNPQTTVQGSQQQSPRFFISTSIEDNTHELLDSQEFLTRSQGTIFSSFEQPSQEFISFEQPSMELISIEQPSRELISIEQPSQELISIEQPSGELVSQEIFSPSLPDLFLNGPSLEMDFDVTDEVVDLESLGAIIG